jgi:hypothetical protein
MSVDSWVMRGIPALRGSVIRTEPPTIEATAVFALFLTLQLLDGLLTHWGVTRLGAEVEANVLLATSMAAVGAQQTLLSAKVLACVCGYILYRLAFHRLVAITAGACLGAAVVPWMLIVGSHLADR